MYTVLRAIVCLIILAPPPHDRPSPYLTVRQVATLLGVGEALTRRLMRRCERPLPAVRFGRLIRVPNDALQSWLLAEQDNADPMLPTVIVSPRRVRKVHL